MKTVASSIADRPWQPASYRFGEGASYNGEALTQEKVLSDRRGRRRNRLLAQVYSTARQAHQASCHRALG